MRDDAGLVVASEEDQRAFRMDEAGELPLSLNQIAARPDQLSMASFKRCSRRTSWCWVWNCRLAIAMRDAANPLKKFRFGAAAKLKLS